MLNKYLKRNNSKDLLKKEMKICVLGDANVGKTTLINQFIKSTFIQEYNATIESRQNKLYKFDNKQFDLHIYDTAGSKELNLFVSDSISHAEGFIIVYSLTDHESIQRIQHYKTLIKNIFKEQKMPIVLVGTKMDLTKQIEISKIECKNASIQHNLPHHFICSTKSKESINSIFKKLIELVILKEKKIKKDMVKKEQINTKIKQQKKKLQQQSQQQSKLSPIDEKKQARLDNENKPRSSSILKMKKYLTLF